MDRVTPRTKERHADSPRIRMPSASVGRLSSLRVRLLAIVLVALTPALALILYSAWEDRQDARDRVQDDALTLTRLSVVQQQQVIEGSRQLLASLALLSATADLSAVEPESCQAVLANLLTELTFYANLGIATPDGNVVCSAVGDPSQPHNIGDRASVSTALASGEFAPGQFLDDPLSGKQALDMTYPIRAPEGDVRGVVFLDLDLEWFEGLTSQAELPEDAVFAVLDSDGTIIARYPGGGVGEQFADEAVLGDVLAGGEGVKEGKGADGTNRLYGYTEIDEPGPTGLYAVVGVPTSTAYSAVNSDLFRNLTALGVVGALVMAAAWFGGEFFVIRQTRRLVHATGRLADGDLSARSRLEDAPGEIGALARAFDEMAESLEARAAAQQRVEDELRALNESLEDRIQERTREVQSQSEALRRSNAELEDFTYVVSHDLKEPLRGIEAFSAFVEDDYADRLDDEGRRYLTIIRESAVRMKELIEDLLELSRVGRQQANRQLTPIATVVDRAVDELRFAIRDHNVDLRLPDSFPTVMSDPLRLKEVFKNLLSNAVKFNGSERPWVEVGWEREGSEYRFSVKDNGIGIEPEYHERVFQIFQRLERREDYPGSGAGLTICKKVIEAHGGRIGVESARGEGATFWFTLPAEEADE